MARTDTMGTMTGAQKAAMIFGWLFIGLGILGFIPGITTNYDRLGTFDEPGAKVLGIFAVNWLHNIVHLLTGLLGLAMAKRHVTARNYLFGFGVIYVGLLLYGLLIDFESPFNFAAMNTPDNWLHAALALGLLGSAFATAKGHGHGTSADIHPAQHRRAS